MARFPRVVVVDVPHHVTQRGNARQVILASDNDRLTYLALLREYAQLYGLSVLGYCLMSNHVHLIAVPHSETALSHSLKQAHGRYAAYWNGQRSSSGHVWQGRFYSCPLDEKHLWEALRYVELNPVRAQMVERPEQWPWPALPRIAGSPPLTRYSKWSAGASDGPGLSGDRFSRKQSRLRHSTGCDSSLTPAVRLVVPSSWSNWRLRCCVH